jgi:hypothetical protein
MASPLGFAAAKATFGPAPIAGMGRMKTLLSGLVVALVAGVAYLACEGAYSLWRADQTGTSLGYQLSARAKASLEPAGDGPGKLASRVIVQNGQVEALLPSFRDFGVALGNTPFDELRTDLATVNYEEDGCKLLKPNLHKTMTYLRSLVYDPFNPPMAFFDATRAQPVEVATFMAAYGVRPLSYRTNEYGERMTLPIVERPHKAIVAGDSVANGAGVSDGETIASRLQFLAPGLQYINIGVGGAEARDVICNLRRAGERYRGQIRKLIYVYCENDFKAAEPFGRPEEVIAWLTDFVREQAIDNVAIVYAPFIFNIFPETTRLRGHRGWDHKYRAEEKGRLRALAVGAGFAWVDIADLARDEMARGRSIFAGLALFVDIVHLSPRGSELLASRILKSDLLAERHPQPDGSHLQTSAP